MVIVPVIDLSGWTNYVNKNKQPMYENPVTHLYFLQIESNGVVSTVYEPTEAGLSERDYYMSGKTEWVPEDEGLEELQEDGMFRELGEMELQGLCYTPLWGACEEFASEKESTCLTGDIMLDLMSANTTTGTIKSEIDPYVLVLVGSGHERIDVSDMIENLTAGVFIGLLYENGAFQGDTREEIKRNLDFLINF